MSPVPRIDANTSSTSTSTTANNDTPSTAELISTHPPVPPFWQNTYKQASEIHYPYMWMQVPEQHHEYQVLAKLIEPHLKINQINRVVNPSLWKQFTRTREELIKSKVEDPAVLRKFGMPEHEIIQRLNLNKKFDTNPIVSATQYSDNLALLFHCTRGNLSDVLNQGLDERLSAPTGLLGKGIYFTDNPAKAANYDKNNNGLLVVAVVLGDCLNINPIRTSGPRPIVREPMKRKELMRNHNDFFFDSTYGNPTGANEFVIYDRNRCVPLYQITYERPNVEDKKTDPLASIRTQPPPFLWTHKQQPIPPFAVSVLPPEGTSLSWPFLAQAVFQQMEKDEIVPPIPQSNPDPEPMDTSDNLSSTSTEWRCESTKFGKLKFIRTRSRNPSNLDRPSSSTQITKNNTEDCPVCFEDYSLDSANWRVLKCSHKVCCACSYRLEKTGTTMSGQIHVFLKCPLCQVCSGIEIGSCPNGEMKAGKLLRHLPGYDGSGTILIRYVIPGPQGRIAIAFLPGIPEGMKVLKLLQTAWDRRHNFSIGTSLTTGKTNVPVWNIHHKTSMTAGPYGFPDPTYLTRVQQELSLYGIQ